MRALVLHETDHATMFIFAEVDWVSHVGPDRECSQAQGGGQ